MMRMNSVSDDAVKKPKTKRTTTKIHPGHAMIAGYLAGFSGTSIGFPLDSVKVWLQTGTIGDNKFLSTTPTAADTATATRAAGVGAGAGGSNTTTVTTTAIFRRYNNTIRALYSGVSGPLITVGMVQSINFATYDATRRFLFSFQQQQNENNDECSQDHDRDYLTQDSLVDVAISGAVAGMVTAVFTAPLLMIKINQQITGNTFREAFRETIDGGGTKKPQQSSRSVFQRLPPYYGPAFVPHLVSEAFGRALYVGTYETTKRFLLARKEQTNYCDHYVNNNNGRGINASSRSSNSSNISLSLQERMACAAVSGILCWAIFFPFDSLRSRMYYAASQRHQQQRDRHNYRQNNNSNTPKQHHQCARIPTSPSRATIWETLQTMRKERSFYRGFTISLLRAGPVAAAVLPVYDVTLEWLSSSSS